MKIKILLILLLATSLSNAQTSEERDKIIANYNLNETKSLIESLNLEEKNKRNRIEEYISQNPEVKEEYYINDKSTDIVKSRFDKNKDILVSN